MIEAFLARIERAFAMDDETWARHANPWSGWTRLPVLPLLALAIWARAWIGAWCLVPIVALVLWAWINPRAFSRPKRADGWMSRAVHGERVLLNAQAVPIPDHHARAARWLTVVPVLGLVPLAWGLWHFDLWATLAGLAVTLGAKLWFLHRMVGLYGDMAPKHPAYGAWTAPCPEPHDTPYSSP